MKQISEYGLKIKNIEASTLFEYNNGVRDHYEYKDAMFTNSLFKDFLTEHGLQVWKDESTRDIICLEFNYGSRSYEDEISHLKKIAKEARTEYKIAKSFGYQTQIDKKRNKRKKIASLFLEAQSKSEQYQKLNKEEIRKVFYNEGVNVEYISRKKNGEILKRETIHYKMLYRSTGKAKKGSCMFICDRLYRRAYDFLYMGIKLPKKNAQIVEISAYVPLISSAIIGKIEVNPKNILILKDVDRYFTTNVVSIETNEERHCIAKHLENYSLKNTLFDGQALIDSSIFPKWGNGYILLRNHFCKMAAFNTNMQDFFRDYLGENYESATVRDMFGTEHYVKDIQIVTTENAMKWIKFDVSYETWCSRVNENGNQFGIVKTAHESKFGDVQRMSYQMVNSLDYSIMEQVSQASVDYVNELKQDNNAFLKYLRKNQNFSNDYEVLIDLCAQDPDFVNSSYFRERKRNIIKSYVLKVKSGKLLQNAENLVIVGSPFAMLLYAATGNPDDVDKDPTFSVEEGTIQCYTERFSENEYLAFFRSPFNSKNNLAYLHNVSHENFKKYFNLGQLVLAVNMNGTDFQDRNNGSDQDSDSGYCTNQPQIVEHARRCYCEYPTIVNNIPKEKAKYTNSMNDFAKMDNALASSQRDIGESSNLAQIAQTYSCNFTSEKYVDYVCILSVIAQAAIDNAKRRFDIDISKEIQYIKKDMNIDLYGYPDFWTIIRKEVNKKKINHGLCCPMNYLYDIDFSKFHDSSPTIPISEFFQKYELDCEKRKCKQVEALITKYFIKLHSYNLEEDIGEEDYLLLRNDFDDLIEDIRKIKISKNYLGLFSWIIDRAFQTTPKVKSNQRKIKTIISKNRSLLLKILYDVNPENLLMCFSKHVKKG